MSDLQALYDERGKAIHQMRDIYAQAEKENRGLNADEEANFANAEKDVASLDARIQRGEEVRKLLNSQESAVLPEVAENRSNFTTTVSTTAPADEKRTVTYSEAFAEWASTGTVSSAEARAVLHTGEVKGKEFRGILTQDSSTAPGALGGYLSPEEWASQVVESMKAYGGMLQAGQIINTKGGDTLHIPTEDTTSQLGDIIGQGVADDVADTTWGEKTMGAYTYTSKIIKVSQELYAEDDAYNILGRVGDIVASRVGRKLNLDFTTGAGTTLPFGVVVSSTLGKTAAAINAVTRTEILDLIHSVDPAYRVGPKVGLMMNDATLANIRKLSIGSADDRPLWSPSMREGAPDTIEGYKYYINQDMPAMTTGLKSMLFGDFSKYWIRQVRGMTLSRSDQRFWDERVVAYFLTARYDGLLTDTAAVKHLIQA